jgi:3-hydroxy-3-methylglutaryl CoA synthase
MTTGILAVGAYIPQSRLSRQAMVEANAWFNPGLRGLSQGERAMANWDEDAVTMAVEAARDCLIGLDRAAIGAAYMASTSYPFLERQNSGIVADALGLASRLQAMDVAGSQRAGTSALIAGFKAARGGETVLVAAADKRPTKSASTQELTYGDGAAALLLGEAGQGVELIAELLGAHSETVDFIDHYRSLENPYDYRWEERWIRDEGYLKIAPAAINALLTENGAAAAGVAHFCFPSPQVRTIAAIAKSVGFSERSIADNLQENCGDTGVAHPLLMLAKVLEYADEGDLIVAAGFGQGCDALLFRATGKRPAGLGVAGHLARRYEETNYQKFMAFNNLVTMEHGLRAETDKNTGLSTHYRNKDMAQGMIGGKCSQCGTAQFPRSNVCVNPQCNAVGAQRPEPFADATAKINSYTADQLTYSMNPPAYYGMVQFDKGGRLMMDFTDITPATKVAVDLPMRMMFRVKDYDTRRGFRRYFWKAVPLEL